MTGCFKTHLTYDVRDFGDKQMNVSLLPSFPLVPETSSEAD